MGSAPPETTEPFNDHFLATEWEVNRQRRLEETRQEGESQ